MGIEYIQPGKPQQNAYIERYNRTVRHEWLDQNIFETIEEAQDQTTEWLWTYNNELPNMAIGGVTPSMKLEMAALFYKRSPLKMAGVPSKVRRTQLLPRAFFGSAKLLLLSVPFQRLADSSSYKFLWLGGSCLADVSVNLIPLSV